MALVNSLITKEKYSVKCPYSMFPIGICIHNTANDASARAEISYMKRNNNEVSFHIAIDDKEAILGIPLNRNAWHSGDGEYGKGNRKYIAIEICYSKSGGEKFIQAENRAIKEIVILLKKYGWTVDNIKKHNDFSNKYCPHRTLDLGWERFINKIQEEINNINNRNNSTELYRVRKTWKDVSSQIGAFKVLDNAINCANKNEDYKVFNSRGKKVYPNL